MIQLILQRFGTGTYYGFPTAHKSRDEVRKRLSRAGTCLDNKFVAIGDCLSHSFRHPALPRAWRKTGQQVFQRAPVTKIFSQICHGEKITRLQGATRVTFQGMWRAFEDQTTSKGVLQIEYA